MKKVFLNMSASLVGLGILIGLYTALINNDPELLVRLPAAAWVCVLGSVGLFFVGLVYPKN